MDLPPRDRAYGVDPATLPPDNPEYWSDAEQARRWSRALQCELDELLAEAEQHAHRCAKLLVGPYAGPTDRETHLQAVELAVALRAARDAISNR